jgi:hypothetical protein
VQKLTPIGQLRALIERKQFKPTRQQVLTVKPLRNPLVTWERKPSRDEDEGAVVQIQVPRRSDRLGNIAARWFKLPTHRIVELDPIGSDVWERCDGKHSLDGIAREIAGIYKLNKRQSETSVTAYLKMLADRRLIGIQSSASARGATAGKQKKA